VLAVAEETLAQMINELNAGSMGDLNRHLARIDVPRASVVLNRSRGAVWFKSASSDSRQGREMASPGVLHPHERRRAHRQSSSSASGHDRDYGWVCDRTADLELRGEGDVLGTRQAGMPEFRVADLFRDAARAPVEGSSANAGGRHCPICGKLLRPRQRVCSGRCRAELSRRRQAEARQARNQQIRELLVAALALLGKDGPP
jgi:predicted nucleic acid-binding Zn ribbon protein